MVKGRSYIFIYLFKNFFFSPQFLEELGENFYIAVLGCICNVSREFY